MSEVAVILGVDDAFGAGLASRFESLGWKVFGLTSEAVDLSSIASMKAAASTVSAAVDHVDVLVCNVHPEPTPARSSPPIPKREGEEKYGQSTAEPLDFEAMKRAHELNGLASLRFVEAFLPLMSGGLKRICFVTGPEAVVGERQVSDVGIGVRMSRATVPMAATIISNDLGRDGYSVRLYVPDGDAQKAVEYLTGDVDDARPRIFDPNGKDWGW